VRVGGYPQGTDPEEALKCLDKGMLKFLCLIWNKGLLTEEEEKAHLA